MSKPKKLNQLQWFKNLSPTKNASPYEIAPGDKGRKNGKVSEGLKKHKGTPGVYIITDPKGKVAYVGATGYSLYTAVLRRFQEWNDNTPTGRQRFNRVTYNASEGYTFRVIPINNDPKRDRIFRVEDYFIKKLKPSDNIEGIDFEPFNPNSGEDLNQYYARREEEEAKAMASFLKAGGSKKNNKGEFAGSGDLDDFLNGAKQFINEILPF